MSAKIPPRWYGEEKYELWKRDVELWGLTSALTKGVQAVTVYLNLEGKAKLAASQIPTGELNCNEGLANLFVKLDALFLLDKGARQYEVFERFDNLRRRPGVDIRSFVSEWGDAYFRCTELDMSLPDTVQAFKLLKACDLDLSDRKLVISSLATFTFKAMTDALLKILAGKLTASGSGNGVGVGVKSEPVFVSEDSVCPGDRPGGVTGEAYFAGGEVRGRPRARGFGGGARVRASGRSRARGSWRRQNPNDSEGKVSRCVVCDSMFHWARDCPDSYEAVGRRGDGGVRSGKADFVGGARPSRDEGSSSGGGDSKTYMLWYAGNRHDGLMEECKGYALLDSGCSRTVCGAYWYESFLEGLSESERDALVVENSEAVFTFADGNTVKSVMRVTIPCVVEGCDVGLVSEVVDCNIPLLLSRVAMKRAGFIVNFGTDQMKFLGNVLRLKVSSSGHYLIKVSKA